MISSSMHKAVKPWHQLHKCTFLTSNYLRFHSTTTSAVGKLLGDLRQLDTSSLCDAEKMTISSENDDSKSRIRLMNSTIRPMNYCQHRTKSAAVMAGIARTVSFTEPNDFLPLMRALALEATTDEVLVVDTMSSTRAVAGEIFVGEARRKQMAGIVIDGPVRDTAHLDDDHGDDSAVMRLYATGITPYSGTLQSPGKMQAKVMCGGVLVQPGDIIMGDQDGVLVGDITTFSKLLPIAKTIQTIEQKLIDNIALSSEKRSLASMTNLEEHVRQRLDGKDSTLKFQI